MAISEQQGLLRIFKQLPSSSQQTLLAFAEFLQSRHQDSPQPVAPQLKPRPTDESVVGAIKRLAQSYPMLDKAVMLDQTSRLMTEHIIQGRDKTEIIDELETIFSRHYQELIQEKTT